MFKCGSIVCLLLFLLLSSWSVHVCFAVDKAAADEELSRAEDALASAYAAVVVAEGSGANVSDLLGKVKVAGDLLAEAWNAYRLGDYDTAYVYATDCVDEVYGVADEASSLASEAEDAYSARLFSTAAVSSVALSVFFVLSLFFWRFLKRRYFRRVLMMKPELVKTE